MAAFEGRVALITGGASGIGRATAERLRKEGAAVALADVDAAGGRAAAGELGAEFVELDVGDPAQWSRAIDTLVQRHGGLDLAFLNAGITTHPATGQGLADFDIATLDDAAYRRILAVNLDGVVFGVRALAPLLQAEGGGAIVATASVAGLIGFSPDPIYTATKHAVVGLVRALAEPLRTRHITINAVCPGGVRTNILGPGAADALRDRGDLQLMEPSQIADAVVHAVTSGETGRCYVCLYGRPHAVHDFGRIEGLAL